MNKSKLLILIVIAALIAAFFLLDLGRYFSLDYFKSQQAAISNFYSANPIKSVAIFFGIYVAVTALSIPGATVMTLAAGAIFGLLWGTVIVSFASSLGATLAFLAARFVLRDSIQARFGDKLAAINRGIEKDGPFYLFTLRLVPAVPFFVINLVMGLTPLAAWTFYWVSQAGMLAATIVYVNAGTEIAKLDSLKGILSPTLIVSLALIGVFPLIAKWIVSIFKKRKVYARWKKPARFDRNLVVIGAGSAGLVAAYIGAAVRAKVTLIEKHKMGGDCLNTGCVPSKALIRSAKLLSHIKRAPEFGIKSAHAEFDFADAMQRVQRVINTVAPHDSIARYSKLGVECIAGDARITSPWTVTVNDRTLTTRSIVIAAGARPSVPPIPGIDQVGCLTSETVWNLRELPQRLIVLGGGPIGCELAQCFARFGSMVTLVEMLPRLLIREDPEISDMLLARFRAENIKVLTAHRAVQFSVEGGRKILHCANDSGEVRIEFDTLLCAVGRVADSSGYGLETLGIPVSKTHTIEINEYLQTLYPNIYACGDVAGPFQFTHTAAHQAWYAAVNALFGGVRKFKADYSVIPWATFTDPEVARVGLNEQDAKEKNIAYEVTNYGIDGLDRAITDGEAHGIVKVLTVPGKDKILGATIVGEHAADLLAEYVTAMRHGLGLNKILRTIHIYPTFAEANKYAAGAWKLAHRPMRLLQWAERYHGWMRT
jgi:pyruvate/2-oxoglutarate dehydrogenase complex dihydrolipoamide dehydrogenase (E3) component/uncharacterized membrane protein YdjX (TVP38/TMEM64 family)